MVVQYVLLFARRYWPQMMLPITIPVGYLGYCLEAKFRLVVFSLQFFGLDAVWELCLCVCVCVKVTS